MHYGVGNFLIQTLTHGAEFFVGSLCWQTCACKSFIINIDFQFANANKKFEVPQLIRILKQRISHYLPKTFSNYMYKLSSFLYSQETILPCKT